MVYLDGAGSGAAVTDALVDLDLTGTTTVAALTASGVITGSTLEATGDTSSGDNAAIGYTSAEGLILTGQGSTMMLRLRMMLMQMLFRYPQEQQVLLLQEILFYPKQVSLLLIQRLMNTYKAAQE
jgi:hypothetical protein